MAAVRWRVTSGTEGELCYFGFYIRLFEMLKSSLGLDHFGSLVYVSYRFHYNPHLTYLELVSDNSVFVLHRHVSLTA